MKKKKMDKGRGYPSEVKGNEGNKEDFERGVLMKSRREKRIRSRMKGIKGGGCKGRQEV